MIASSRKTCDSQSLESRNQNLTYSIHVYSSLVYGYHRMGLNLLTIIVNCWFFVGSLLISLQNLAHVY